jgi:hypothetical protein
MACMFDEQVARDFQPICQNFRLAKSGFDFRKPIRDFH